MAALASAAPGLVGGRLAAGHAETLLRPAGKHLVARAAARLVVRVVPGIVHATLRPDATALRGDRSLVGRNGGKFGIGGNGGIGGNDGHFRMDGNGVDCGHGESDARIGTVPSHMALFAAEIALHLFHGSKGIARRGAALAAGGGLVGLPRRQRSKRVLLVFLQQRLVAGGDGVCSRSRRLWGLFGLGAGLLLFLGMIVFPVLGLFIHLGESVVGPHSVAFPGTSGSGFGLGCCATGEE